MRLMMTVLSVVAVLCAQAGAKVGLPIQLVAVVGLAHPSGPDDFDKSVDSGLDLAGGVSVRLAPRLSVRGMLSLANLKLDEGWFQQDFARLLEQQGTPPDEINRTAVNIDGGNPKILSLSGELKLDLMQAVAVSPYVLAGGGIARLSTSEATTTIQFPDSQPDVATKKGVTETKGLVTFGGGVAAAAWRKAAVFIEVRYQRSFTDIDPTSHMVTGAGVLISL